MADRNVSRHNSKDTLLQDQNDDVDDDDDDDDDEDDDDGVGDDDRKEDEDEEDKVGREAYDQVKWGKGERKKRRETGQGIQCGLQGCLFEVLEDLEKYRLGMSPISFCCRYAICSWIKRFSEREREGGWWP
ncbi:hypothetical protein M0802_004646 [Mischocyttarus mexicanus]|nr:hypothetical protein M0802_004646 [Mischocyttarus mexicanus]